MNDVMIFPDLNQTEFDYNSLLKSKKIETVTGIPVKIDKIIRDITDTTVLAVGGTMVMQGTRVRAIWDLQGNVIEYKRMRNFLLPRNNWTLSINGNEDMLRLVSVENINIEQK